MIKELLSDISVIAMHCVERITVAEVCLGIYLFKPIHEDFFNPHCLITDQLFLLWVLVHVLP